MKFAPGLVFPVESVEPGRARETVTKRQVASKEKLVEFWRCGKTFIGVG